MSMFLNRKKRKRLHKNRVQFPEDYLDIWGPQHGHRLETFRYTLTVTLSFLVPSLTLESKDTADTTDQVPKLIKKNTMRGINVYGAIYSLTAVKFLGNIIFGECFVHVGFYFRKSAKHSLW